MRFKSTFTYLLSFTFIFLLNAKFGRTQSEKELTKMHFYYVDENYEKLLDMALDFTEDEDTRRNALPYIYASVAYYQISKIEEFDEEYPRSFRNALKYAVKFRKKDEENEHVEEWAEYVDGLKKQTYELADNYYQIGKYTKAKSYYKYLVGMDPEDWGSWFLKGVTEARLNIRTDSELSLETAVEGLKKLEPSRFSDYLPGQHEILKEGIIFYSDFLKENGKISEAKEIISLGYEFYDNDNEYRISYDELMRG